MSNDEPSAPSRCPGTLVSGAPLPRLHVLSDLRLDERPYELPERLDFDVLVAAGGIGAPELAVPWLARIGKPVVYVLGERECCDRDMADALALARELSTGTQVQVLERDCVVLHGVRFLGATLWTSLAELREDCVHAAWGRMQAYRRIGAARWLATGTHRETVASLCKFKALPEPGVGVAAQGMLHPVISYVEHKATLGWLRRALATPFDGATVVVSHHAPTLQGLPPEGIGEHAQDATGRTPPPLPVGCIASELLRSGPLVQAATHVSLWIHGRAPAAMDHCVGQTRVLCNSRAAAPLPASTAPVCAPSELRFEPCLVVDLAQGPARAVQAAVRPVQERMRALLGEMSELLPLMGQAPDVLDRCVRECLARRLEESARLVGHLRATVLPCLDSRAVQGNSPLDLSCEFLAAPCAAQALTVSEGQRAIARCEAALAWAGALPSALDRRLAAWCEQAGGCLGALGSAGIAARVVLPDAGALSDVREHCFTFVLTPSCGSAQQTLAAALLEKAFGAPGPFDGWPYEIASQPLGGARLADAEQLAQLHRHAFEVTEPSC